MLRPSIDAHAQPGSRTRQDAHIPKVRQGPRHERTAIQGDEVKPDDDHAQFTTSPVDCAKVKHARRGPGAGPRRTALDAAAGAVELPSLCAGMVARAPLL